MGDYFKYRYLTNIEFNVNEGSFISVIGNSNDFFIDTLLNENKDTNVFVGDAELNKETIYKIRKRLCVVLHKHTDIFLGETVRDELSFGLESLAFTRNDMNATIQSGSRLFKIDHLLDRDPNSLGSSDKIKMKILSSLIIRPKVMVLDNIICELDYYDKLLVFNILDEYKKKGGIVINVTNDIEETMFSDRIIVLHDNTLVCDGKTISVLNEEKMLKRLGIGLPFIIELNKYLMDYGMIDKYYLTNEKLVGALWK